MIEIKNVYKNYGNLAVLKGFSLSCNPGCIYNLLGVNGAGKTTLINIMSGLLLHDAGSVYINGTKVFSENENYRKAVGYVFEKPIFIEKLTAIEYLDFAARLQGMPKDLRKTRINELLEFFELDKEQGKLIEHLSKGTKSRVSLAAALLHQPMYLILDEPFDGIDFLMLQKIVRLFKDMAKQGATIFVSLHQLQTTIDMADHFAILIDGQLGYSFSSAQLREDMTNDKSINGNVNAFFEKLILDKTPKKDLSG